MESISASEKKLFESCRFNLLSSKNTLFYEEYISCIEISINKLDVPFIQSFLLECCGKAVSILVTQAGQLRNNQTESTQKCIDITAHALPICMSLDPFKFIEIACNLLDPKAPLYCRVQSQGYYDANSMNMGYMRTTAVKSFRQSGGFSYILHHLSSKEFPWLGAAKLRVILFNLLELKERDLLDKFKECTYFLLETLSEDSMKKESSDHIMSLFTLLSDSSGGGGSHNHTQWLNYILKCLQSSSIVLKLIGWDLIQHLVEQAIHQRPFAKYLHLSNAGSPEVNGIYKIIPKETDYNPDESPKYKKESNGEANNSSNNISIFRAPMANSKEKWWFISIPDESLPYTDLDVDYYNCVPHFSKGSKDVPEIGWNILNSGKGVNPPPRIIKREEYVPPSRTIDSYLSHNLKRWAVRLNLINNLFNNSLHREIISRSSKLLLFLLELDALDFDTIKLIWSAGYNSQEEDITEEIFTLISNIFSRIPDQIQINLINYVLDLQLSTDAKSTSQIPIFLEKLSSIPFSDLQFLCADSINSLIEITWNIFKSKNFPSFKGSSKIENLLTQCLKTSFGESKLNQYIQQSNESLLDQNNTSSLSCQCDIRCLTYLLPRAGDIDNSKKALFDLNLHVTFEKELVRYLSENRKLYVNSSLNQNDYTKEIKSRLHLFRCLYGLSQHYLMSPELLLKLWSYIKLTCERDMMFQFFGEIITSSPDLLIAINLETLLIIYNNVFCDANLNWSECSEEMFNTFHEYFRLSYTKVFRSKRYDPESIGISTMWSIALNAKNPKVASDSFKLLLIIIKEYVIVFFKTKNDPILERIFFEIATLKKSIKDNNKISVANSVSINRYIEILREYIVGSHGSNYISHGASGQDRSLSINIKWKKSNRNFSNSYNNNYNYQNSYNYYDSVNEGSYFLNISPFTTIYRLKLLIAQELSINYPSKITIEINKEFVLNESEVLSHFNLSRGCDIFAAYTPDNMSQVKENMESDNVAQVISKNKSYFNSLLSLIDLILYEYDETSKTIWDVLFIIPSNLDMISICIDFARNANELYLQLFQSSIATAVYLLQITSSLLRSEFNQNSETSGNFADFVLGFISKGGFHVVFDFFLSTENNDSTLSNLGLKNSLEIIYTLIYFPTSLEIEKSHNFLDILTCKSSEVVNKLIELATQAAKSDESAVVQKSLAIINLLVKNPEVSQSLTKNPRVKTLISDVLLSDSEIARKIASEFAYQYGNTQPAVFTWLVDVFSNLSLQSEVVGELTNALEALIQTQSRGINNTEMEKLARDISSKLTSNSLFDNPSEVMLVSCFKLEMILLNIDQNIIMNTELGKNLLNILFSSILFSVPKDRDDQVYVCDSEAIRSSAFDLILVYLEKNPKKLSYVIEKISKISENYSKKIKHVWLHQIFNEVKKNNLEYAGLKNQGCTCYINSLLQQLYMNVELREVILSTPLKDSHRSTLWHKSNEELVGIRYKFQWKNGTYHKALIKAFDPHLGHLLEYEEISPPLSKICYVNIREGGINETGRVRPYDDEDYQINESDSAAIYILEQLQRTFCFLNYSKRRYFDPRPFVEACKTLNLNFNVFQQNDAVEFCDKLLDRMEISMKGKYTGVNSWKKVVNLIGGNLLYQKIPLSCSFYESDKKGCGHWQGSRNENFLKIELIIRGKESIEESLQELVKCELMDGDNKISCDVCNEKKATNRITCFDVLPNSFILHLKRFDLDFETFETVKLNNRLEFPSNLNMYKFTRQCRESEEEKISTKESLSEPTVVSNTHLDSPSKSKNDKEFTTVDAEVNLEDFDYELQGVLVHAGIAQGGHYYSFACDSSGKWFRFDDDDVSYFDSEHIADECFGGPSNLSNASFNSSPTTGPKMSEHDRTTNALMLFYKKKIKVEKSDTDVETETLSQSVLKENLVDGYQAFENEVLDLNIQHNVSIQLLDPALHNFVLSTLKLSDINKSDIKNESVLNFGINFFLNIILHYKDRSNVPSWHRELNKLFKNNKEFLVSFLEGLVSAEKDDWLFLYLFQCSDYLARASFVNLLFPLLSISIPEGVEDLSFGEHGDGNGKIVDKVVIIIQEFIRKLVFYIHTQAPKYPRSLNEFLSFVRQLCRIPCVRKYMLEIKAVEGLIQLILPNKSNDEIKNYLNQTKFARQELFSIIPVVVETISALVVSPALNRVPIFDDCHGNKTERKLTEEAREIFENIFDSLASDAGIWDTLIFAEFQEKCNENGHQANISTIQAEFDKYDKAKSGKWEKYNFFSYVTETFCWNNQLTYKILEVFGYRANLTKMTSELDPIESSILDSYNTIQIPPSTKLELSDVSLYEQAFKTNPNNSHSSNKILMKITNGDINTTTNIMTEILDRLYHMVEVKEYMNSFHSFIHILKTLVEIEDSFSQNRIAMLMTTDHGLCSVIFENRGNLGTQQPGYNNQQSLLETYIEIGKEFYSIYKVANWVDNIATNNESVNYFLSKVNPNRRLIPSPEAVESRRRSRVTVTGAIEPHINGIYLYVKKAPHGSLFQKVTDLDGVTCKFSIYRWFMRNNIYLWFISQTPAGNEHGTKDTDFYSAPSSFEQSKAYTDDVFPPIYCWKSTNTQEPAPNLVLLWEIMEDENNLSVEESYYKENLNSSMGLDDSYDLDRSNLIMDEHFDDLQDSLSTSPAPRDLSVSPDSELEECDPIQPFD